MRNSYIAFQPLLICGVLRDLVPFVQSKKREKACNVTKINTPPWVFFTFFKLYKYYQIVQRITYALTLYHRFIDLSPEIEKA